MKGAPQGAPFFVAVLRRRTNFLHFRQVGRAALTLAAGRRSINGVVTQRRREDAP
jgi:hypothetical protein